MMRQLPFAGIGTDRESAARKDTFLTAVLFMQAVPAADRVLPGAGFSTGDRTLRPASVPESGVPADMPVSLSPPFHYQVFKSIQNLLHHPIIFCQAATAPNNLILALDPRCFNEFVPAVVDNSRKS